MKKILLLLLVTILCLVVVNADPLFQSVTGNATVDEGSLLQLTLTVSAADNETNTFGSDATYGTLTKNSETEAVYAWTPGYDQLVNGSATYTIVFNVSDGNSSDTYSVAVTVNDVDQLTQLKNEFNALEDELKDLEDDLEDIEDDVNDACDDLEKAQEQEDEDDVAELVNIFSASSQLRTEVK